MAARDRSLIGGRINRDANDDGGPSESGVNTPAGKYIMIAAIVLVFGLMVWWLGSWVLRFFGRFFARYDEIGPE